MVRTLALQKVSLMIVQLLIKCGKTLVHVHTQEISKLLEILCKTSTLQLLYYAYCKTMWEIIT